MSKSIFTTEVQQHLPELGIVNLPQFLQSSRLNVDLAIALVAMSEEESTHPDSYEIHIIHLKSLRGLIHFLQKKLQE